MNEPKQIVVGGNKGLIEVLFELQDIYKFDINMTAKSGELTLKLRRA